MKLRVGPFHWLAEQETVGHDIILPGRSTSCPTFFTQVTHTLGRKWPLSTHTHTPGETTNIDADTQAQTRMQGNGPHQRRAAGVCANANTHRHTLQNSYKPEITSPAHVNLTPPPPPQLIYTHHCSLHRDWKEESQDISSGSLSLGTESISLPSRGALPAWGTPCGRPGGPGWAGKGHGTQVVRGKRGHLGPEGQSYPQSE